MEKGKGLMGLFDGGMDKDSNPTITEPSEQRYMPSIEVKLRYFIGIDNGVTGSIGMICSLGYEFHKTPVRKELNYTKAKSYISRINALELIKILSVANIYSHVMIERPMVNPSRFNATVSALRAFEATITVLETLGLSYEVVDSKKWQKELLPSGVSGEELKPASLSVGKRLFPNAQVGKHTDMDGMLIAEWCRRCKR